MKIKRLVMTRNALLLFVLLTLLVSGGCIRQKRGDVFDSMVDKFGTMDASDGQDEVELDENDFFQSAMALYEQGRYLEAQKRFAIFKNKFQYSSMVPASVFFQGECFFYSKVYIQASRYYHALIYTYPYSSYVPQAKIKNGISMQRIGKNRKADELFTNIIRDYPETKFSKSAALALNGKIHEAEAVVSGVTIEPEVIIEHNLFTKTADNPQVNINEVSHKSQCVSTYPNRYLIVIANSEYKYYGNLSYVNNDVSVLKELGTCYLGVPEQNIVVNRNTTFSELKRIFTHLNNIVRQQDSIVFVYYTGHGVEDQQGSPYLVPVDALLKGEMDLNESTVPLTFVQGQLDRLNVRSKVFIWDACRVDVPWKLIHVKRRANTDIASDSTYIFATSSGNTSNISKQKSISAFLDSLWELAKAGTANFDLDSSGYVELMEIKDSLESRLRRTTVDYRQQLEIKGGINAKIFPVQ